MISDIQQHDHGTGTQHAGQEQRHQQTQARRQPQQQEERQHSREQQEERQHSREQQEERQHSREQQEERQRLRQQRQQEHRERERRRQQRNTRRYQRWQERVAQQQQEPYRQERVAQRETERDRQERLEYQHYVYLQQPSPNFDENMDDTLTERELEEYNLERMAPQDRREVWEQEHLNELQGNPAPRPHGLPLDDTERYAKFLQDQLRRDQHDQTMRVYDMETNDNVEHAEQYRRSQELLRQNEEWEDLAFRHRQI
ncbi:unnamed protein product [Rotaria magnacalcarata]